MELLRSYKNGNYQVSIYEDGTKIRETEENYFLPTFSESCDIKITNMCDIGCPMCHEDSTINGKHSDLLNTNFLKTLHPYTELAIGGGNVLSHPDLIPFLQILKELNILANITVNQIHFEKEQKFIQNLVNEKLIYGLGVSLVDPTETFIQSIKQYKNAVIHTINGIVKSSDFEQLKDNHLKLLILGYKELRRGSDYFVSNQKSIIQNQTWLKNNLPTLIKQFDVVSFDNLSIRQLNVKRLMSKEAWNEFYMGDDSEFTFYIDLVEKKFAKNSTAPFNERYDLLDSIDDMFHQIQKRSL